MAVKDKARVRTLLSAKWPKAARLNNARLDAFAAKLDATDDSSDEDITTELEAINKYTPFEEIVVADDKVANDLIQAKKKAEEAAGKGKGKAKTVEPDEDEDEEPEEVPTSPEGKLLLKMAKRMESLESKLQEKEAKEAQDGLATKFAKDERLKGVPAIWLKNATPKSEEDYEEAVTTLADEYKTYAEENKIESYGKDTPVSGTGGGAAAGKVTEVKKEEADEIAQGLLNGMM